MRRLNLRLESGQDRTIFAIAVGLIVVMTLANFPLENHVTVVVPILLGCVLGAALLSWEATAVLGVLAIGGSFVAIFPAHLFGHAQEAVSQGTIGLSVIGFTVGAWQRERSGIKMARALQVASKSQAALMPTIRRALPGVTLATRYQSASDETLIGGDFFEVVHSLFGERIIIGDVSGRGIEAMGLGAAVRRAFIETAATATDLIEVARALDDTVAEVRGHEGEEFVTALLITLPGPGSRDLRIVNCGHHEPIRVRSDSQDQLTPASRGLPLGLGGDRIEGMFDFLPGDRVLCFTDGIVEARNDDGEYFPLDEVYRSVASGESLDVALSVLLTEMVRHTGGPVDDDIALLVLERDGDAATALPR